MHRTFEDIGASLSRLMSGKIGMVLHALVIALLFAVAEGLAPLYLALLLASRRQIALGALVVVVGGACAGGWVYWLSQGMEDTPRDNEFWSTVPRNMGLSIWGAWMGCFAVGVLLRKAWSFEGSTKGAVGIAVAAMLIYLGTGEITGRTMQEARAKLHEETGWANGYMLGYSHMREAFEEIRKENASFNPDLGQYYAARLMHNGLFGEYPPHLQSKEAYFAYLAEGRAKVDALRRERQEQRSN